MSVGTSFQSADALLTELGVEKPEDIDLEAIAQYCEATIVYQKLDSRDAVLLSHAGRAIIMINMAQPRGRQRFSAAHKLGHWLLDGGRVLCARSEGGPSLDEAPHPAECNANTFAADLLMPLNMFQPLSAGKRPCVDLVQELAETFKTSLMATALRLVKTTSHRCILICSQEENRLWTWGSRAVPRGVPLLQPAIATIESRIGQGPRQVEAARWFEIGGADEHTVTEEHVVDEGYVLTLLTWDAEE